METRSWVAVGVLLVALLVVERTGADYVWDGEQWQWQDVPAPSEDTEEGSGDVEVVGGGRSGGRSGGRGRGGSGIRYRDDEDDLEGSAEEEDSYRERDGGGYNTHRLQEESINVDADEEINPNELDIGFHDEPTAGSTEPPQPTRAIVDDSDVGLVAGKETASEGPHRQPQGGETNFFAQPGILAAVVGGTVVGLLCTILLVMLIVYRMRKADEGSYALNEPKRSPNVHSYLKAPTREFFA